MIELPNSEATALLKNTLPLPYQTSNPIILNSALLSTESTKAILSLFKKGNEEMLSSESVKSTRSIVVQFVLIKEGVTSSIPHE